MTQPLTSLTQLKDEVRSIERRLREAQAAVAEQEAAMRVDEGEKHRAEQRRQECSRQWAKDDEKLCALQRSVQANDANRRKLFAVNVTLCQPYRPSLSLRRILRDCSCRSKLPRSQARLFFAVLARDSAAVSQCHMSLTLVASVTGLVSGQNSAQMSIDAAAREAMGFISEHLKVAS